MTQQLQIFSLDGTEWSCCIDEWTTVGEVCSEIALKSDWRREAKLCLEDEDLDPHARLSGIMSDGSHLSLHVVFFDPYLDAASADALPAEVVENTRDEDREFFRPRPNVFVNIPDGQEIIEHRAFGNMRNLRKVLFPASAYAIRKQAFFRL